jgi:hypothetical protein
MKKKNTATFIQIHEHKLKLVMFPYGKNKKRMNVGLEFQQ